MKEGKYYSKSAFISIRSSLNRHLITPPHKAQLNLMRDIVFLQANQVLTGVLRQLWQSGLDVTEHIQYVLYECGVWSLDNLQGLLNRVFVEISLHFGHCGQEGLRSLSNDSIVLKHDDFVKEYATICFNVLD